MASVNRHLWRAIDLKLSELLQPDFWLGVAGGVGGVILALNAPDGLFRAVDVAAQALSVVVGSVIAGVAIQAAFFDQAFLRKLRAINRDPVRYLAPFLFTAVIGVGALLSLMALATLGPEAPRVALGPLGGLVGFLTVWALASLLPCLATLVQFIGLKMDALDVPDDIEADIKPRRVAGD